MYPRAEIERRRTLAHPTHADDHDVGLAERAEPEAVVVFQREFHRLDPPAVGGVELMQPRHVVLRHRTDAIREKVEQRSGGVEMRNPPEHTRVPHQLLRRLVGQCVQHDRSLARQLGERGLDLFEVVVQRVRDHLEDDAGKLARRDRRQPAEQFTRRRGDQVNRVSVVGRRADRCFVASVFLGQGNWSLRVAVAFSLDRRDAASKPAAIACAATIRPRSTVELQPVAK